MSSIDMASIVSLSGICGLMRGGGSARRRARLVGNTGSTDRSVDSATRFAAVSFAREDVVGRRFVGARARDDDASISVAELASGSIEGVVDGAEFGFATVSSSAVVFFADRFLATLGTGLERTFSGVVARRRRGDLTGASSAASEIVADACSASSSSGTDVVAEAPRATRLRVGPVAPVAARFRGATASVASSAAGGSVFRLRRRGGLTSSLDGITRF